MVAKLYEKDTYKGAPTHVYEIPCDTNITGYDRYPTDAAEAERDALMRATTRTDPALLSEFQELMRHHRSSILRDEFVRCSGVDCRICPRRSKKTGVDEILEKFPGGMLPTPIPVFLPDDDGCSVGKGPSGNEQEPCDELDRGCENVSKGKKLSERYRTLGDLTKISMPPQLCYPDAYYRGDVKLLRCPLCPLKTFKTQSGLERHRKLEHVL